MTTTPLPPLPLGYDSKALYTADQMQAYAQQARADLEAENARLREALAEIAENSDDSGAAEFARFALKGTP